MTLERAIVILRTMAGDWMETIMPEYLDEFCDTNGFDKEEIKFHQHKVDRNKIEAGTKIFDSLLALHNLKNKV